MAYWKKIKNTNAVPVLKDELVFDQTPTVNSTNPVTSDGVARAIAGASGEVPVVTESDNGKILTAIYDEGGAAVEWATPSGGGSDDVAVLTYGTSTWNDVSAAIAANKHLAVQGNVSLTYYTYNVYSDDMTYDDGVTSGSGYEMVSWCVVDPIGSATYRVQLFNNDHWNVEPIAALPPTSMASAGQILSLNYYRQPVWTTPADAGMKWSRNTHPTVDASNGITATLSGLSVINSACVVNVSLRIDPTAFFTTNIPSTLTFKVLQNLEYGDWYFGTLTAELSSYQGESRPYRACGTVTLPYGSSELSQIVIYDPNGTSLVVSGATYEVSVGVAK